MPTQQLEKSEEYRRKSCTFSDRNTLDRPWGVGALAPIKLGKKLLELAPQVHLVFFICHAITRP